MLGKSPRVDQKNARYRAKRNGADKTRLALWHRIAKEKPILLVVPAVGPVVPVYFSGFDMRVDVDLKPDAYLLFAFRMVSAQPKACSTEARVLGAPLVAEVEQAHPALTTAVTSAIFRRSIRSDFAVRDNG